MDEQLERFQQLTQEALAEIDARGPRRTAQDVIENDPTLRPFSARLTAKEIVRQSRAPTLFVEVNTGGEGQKSGVPPEQTDAFVKTCRDTYGLAIAGLMCIPPFEEPPAPHFALLAKIARRNGLPLLSMGMSADFALAVRFGATHVRVGTAIFGTRH